MSCATVGKNYKSHMKTIAIRIELHAYVTYESKSMMLVFWYEYIQDSVIQILITVIKKHARKNLTTNWNLDILIQFLIFEVWRITS